MKDRRFTLLAVVFFAAIAILILFFRDATQGTISFEVAKALLQIGVVAVFGAAVSWVMSAYQFEQARLDRTRERAHQELTKERDLERQRHEYRDDLLKETLSRAVSAYASTKKARRLLRSRVGSEGTGERRVRLTDYDWYMEAVNDAQLEFESLKCDVRTSSPAFSDGESIEAHLETMEQYLGRLIKEYEGNRHIAELESDGVPLALLARLTDFLAKAETKQGFKDSFIDPYHQIQGKIRKELLHPRLPSRVDA